LKKKNREDGSKGGTGTEGDSRFNSLSKTLLTRAINKGDQDHGPWK